MQITGPAIKSIVSVIVLLILFCSCRTVSADGAPQVKTDKDVYSVGETIRVSFIDATGDNWDWVCIVPAASPDSDAGDYQNLPHGVSQGVLTFNAPPANGKYEVRAYYNYSRKGYVVAARYPFSVGIAAPPPAPVAALEISTPPENAPASPPIKYAPSGSVQTNIAVFYFTPLSIDVSHYGMTVTNALINHPKLQSTFIVLSRKDLEMFLSGNNLQQNDRPDNMIDIGARLGMNFVIAGSIMKRGSIITTNYKVAGVGQRNVIYSNQFKSSGEADLISNVAKMSDDIIAAILRATN